MTTELAAPRPAAGGRHRGRRRDPVGGALTALWGLGHIVTLTLLGASVTHQLGGEHPSAAPLAQALPDHESAG